MNRVGGTDGLTAQLSGGEAITLKKVLVPERIRRMRQIAGQIYVDERIKTYVLDIVFATRNPDDYHLNLGNLIRFGASPRASIGIFCAVKAHAFLKGRGYVMPEDVKHVAADVLRHRLLLTYEAEAEGMKSDDIVQKILTTIPAP
jgi:MoxR-like ATPase